MSYLKRPRGAFGCSQCCSTGGHGGAAEENSDEGKFIPCHLASPSDTIRESQFPIWLLVSGFFHSTTRAAVGIWSKSSRGRRRLLSSAVVDMLTRTTPQNWHRMSARNSAPCVALWYVHFRPVSLRAYWCPLVSLTFMHYVDSNSTTSMTSVIVERWDQMGLNCSPTFHLIILLSWAICVCLWYMRAWGKEKRHRCCSRSALGNSPVLFGRMCIHKNADRKVIQRIFGRGHI